MKATVVAGAVGGGGVAAALPIPNFHRRIASMSTLPEELVVKILSYLPHFPGLTRCSTVNKKWHRLATCEELWKQVYLGQVRARAHTHARTSPLISPPLCAV
jgi:hypothetical protein